MKPLLALALLSLAACEREGGQQSAEEVAGEMARIKLEPGQWETANEVLSANAPGLPPQSLREMVGRKTVAQNCLTPEEAATPKAKFLAAQQDSECAFRNFSTRNGRMKGEMSCTRSGDAGTMVMKIEGEYASQRYFLDMEMEAKGGKMDMTVKARATGRRIGDCR